jgi:predicted flap endonuclease-1-like 5' DNA nuclease
MSTTKDSKAPAPHAGGLADRIGAIEAELARITGAIAQLQAIGRDPAAVARLKADTARVSAAAATAAKDLKITAEAEATASAVPALPATIPLALLSLASEQLTLIRGVDSAAANLLNEAGIHRFADIAALNREDVAELGKRLGDRRRISRQGWIEQAAVLAAGIETAHAARTRAGQLACITAAATESVAAALVAPTSVPSTRAEVIDLSRRQAQRHGAAPAKRSGLARITSIAAVLLLAGGLGLSGKGFRDRAAPQIGAADRCATPIAQLWSSCPLAMMP